MITKRQNDISYSRNGNMMTTMNLAIIAQARVMSATHINRIRYGRRIDASLLSPVTLHTFI